jgi:Zn finger protein HypA/HybF involved in hydrogenase expression
MEKFTITCNKCGSTNVAIREEWSEDYDWDENLTVEYEKSYFECLNCGNNDYYGDDE